jgi:hypothetical protein
MLREISVLRAKAPNQANVRMVYREFVALPESTNDWDVGLSIDFHRHIYKYMPSQLKDIRTVLMYSKLRNRPRSKLSLVQGPPHFLTS